MRLSQLVERMGAQGEVRCVFAAGGTDPIVPGISADSRAAIRGDIFAALTGSANDGTQFIGQAVAEGAVAVLVKDGTDVPQRLTVPVVVGREPRRALALMAAALYPSQPATVVAVTGTSGKTSVADFTRQIFAALGHEAASLGTIGVIRSRSAVYGSLTTPDPVTLHKTLMQLTNDGVTHLAMEASSHGLDQFRLDGVRLSAGAFLNLGRDHLDYHPSVDAYLEAKLRLFRELLQPGQPAVVVADAPFAERAKAAAADRGLQLFTVGAAGDGLRLLSAERDGFGQKLRIGYDGREVELRLDLIGNYQASNALVAAGVALAVGGPAKAVFEAMAGLKGVVGRLEVVGERNGGLAIVDYAHKPEALIAALDAVRPFVSGRLVCVMGCGGDRDRGKRPIMGAIAAAKADLVIVTDDNPRNEDPALIRAAILAGGGGAANGRAEMLEIADRGDAIRAAVAGMQPGDVVLVAGKGHEPGQIVGKITLPFSDHDAVRTALTSP